MEHLMEHDKQQVRDRVFQPMAKFIGKLAFDTPAKFKKKLFAFQNKLQTNTGWSIKHTCKYANNNIVVGIFVKCQEGHEVMNLDVVVKAMKK